MRYCPECGGEMHYDPKFRSYVCNDCGLSLSSQELMEMKDQLRPETERAEEKRKKKQRDYLNWWLSKKD